MPALPRVVFTVVLLLCSLCWLAGCEPSAQQSGANAPAPANTAAPANAPGAPGRGAVEVVIPEPPAVPKEVVPTKEPDKQLTVGVSLLTREHQFYKDMEAAMREEAARHKIKLNILSAEMKASDQLNQVQTFVSQKVDALILCPVNSQSSGSAVALANEAKIPVFTADIASKTGDVVCHVASNNEQGGELIGKYLGEKLGGKGDIAIIDFPTVTSVQERVRGFEKAIGKFPGIKIVARPAPTQPLKAVAFPVAQDLLQSHSTLKGIFGINDDCALGVVQAASATGRENLIVVGFDGTPQAVETIRQGGVLYADATQFPTVIGRSVISAIAKHAVGETVPKSVPIDCKLVKRK